MTLSNENSSFVQLLAKKEAWRREALGGEADAAHFRCAKSNEEAIILDEWNQNGEWYHLVNEMKFRVT